MAMQEAKTSRPGLSAHPEERELEAFLRGELPRDEVRAIVRHLLTACPACRRVTGRLWALGGYDEPIGSERREPFMNEIETAQARLLEIVRGLEALKLQLLDLLASLPPLAAETVRLLDVEPADPGTEIRTVIQCVLHDSLEPAIRDLRDASTDASTEGGAAKTA